MHSHLNFFRNNVGRFDRNNNSNRRDSDRQVTMHSAVCDACGRECKVPFRPSGDKPIYCSSCFEQQGGGRDRGDRGDRRDSRNSRDDRDFRDSGDRGGKGMYSAICDDCGNKCLVPFKPSSDKPIYCSSCFEKRGNSHDGESKGSGNNMQSEKLDLIIEKLEKIVLALEVKTIPVEKKAPKKNIEEKKVEKKEPAKKKTVKKAKKE